MTYYGCIGISRLGFQVSGRIDTGMRVLSLCCEPLDHMQPGIPLMDTPEETLACFLGMRDLVIAEGIRQAQDKKSTHVYSAGCAKCAKYQLVEEDPERLISIINLSMYPSPCQCKCVYCGNKFWLDTPEVKTAYEKLFSTLELAKSIGAIEPNAMWQVSSGEITIHPYRKRILELIRGYPARFLTNAFLYDEDIAAHIRENPDSELWFSMDSGTPETWCRVKGFDNFEEVLTNLEKYRTMIDRAGRLILGYIILPGLNDSDEDFRSFAEIANRLNVSNIYISRDTRVAYKMSVTDRKALICAAARLATVCKKNHVLCNIHRTYQPEEVIEINKLLN